ncbi:MAG: ATP-binding protein [Pseudomonadota bacterium]
MPLRASMSDSHLPPPADPLRRWLIRAPVSVALVLTAAIIAASGLVGWWNARTLAATGAELADASSRAAALESLQAALLDADNAHLRHLLDGADPQAVTARVRAQLDRLLATPPAPEAGPPQAAGPANGAAAARERVRRQTEAVLAIWEHAASLRRSNRPDEALVVLSQAGQAPLRDLLSLLARLHDEQSRRLVELRRQNDAAARRGVWGANVVAALALLSLAAFAAVVQRSRRRLQESQARFSQLAETMPQLAWIAREDGYITWFNQRWYDYTGTTPAQMEGWGWQSVHDPAELPRVMREWQAGISNGQPLEMVFPLRGADGVLRPFLTRVAPLKDDHGRVLMWFGTNTDISQQQATADALRDSERRERERAEMLESVMQRLREREEDLRSLTDNTPDILSRFDRELRHVFVNAAVTRATGQPTSHFIGKTNRELGMPPELCDRWDACLRAVFETGQPQGIEFSYRSPDGVRHFQGRFIPEWGADGQVVSALGVTHDCTAQKAAADALLEADRRKDEFLATLAHELRNPLTPIRTGLHILKRAAGTQPPDPAGARIRDMMERQVDHMVRLIDDLLDVARISTGKIELRHERVLLSAVVDSALDTSRPLLEAARHEVELCLPGEPVWLHGDAVRLAQVVANLLNNAAKYTPERGRIRLHARVDDARVELSVADNGIGIPPAELSRIFAMFAQAGPALQRSHGGLGIGLALVQRLVELHGGSVSAHSDGPGQGATFTLTLPLAPAEEAAGPVGDAAQQAGLPAPDPAAEAACRPAGWPVLVVDDNVDAADSLGTVLQLAGHEVRIEHDGARALRQAGAWMPRAVLLDIGMPGMDGFEVAARLRALAAGRPLLLVAVTGWGSEDMRQRARQAGFDLHLTKPVEPAAVVELLAQACAQDAAAAGQAPAAASAAA